LGQPGEVAPQEAPRPLTVQLRHPCFGASWKVPGFAGVLALSTSVSCRTFRIVILGGARAYPSADGTHEKPTHGVPPPAATPPQAAQILAFSPQPSATKNADRGREPGAGGGDLGSGAPARPASAAAVHVAAPKPGRDASRCRRRSCRSCRWDGATDAAALRLRVQATRP
jgi:hypothetical protein